MYKPALVQLKRYFFKIFQNEAAAHTSQCAMRISMEVFPGHLISSHGNDFFSCADTVSQGYTIE